MVSYYIQRYQLNFYHRETMWIFLLYFDQSFQSHRGWSPRSNQRWTALFHIFGVFQRWFREHEKHQRWSALFQSWSALIFSESAMFRDFQVMNSAETDLKVFWIRADQRWMSLRPQPGHTKQKSSKIPRNICKKLPKFDNNNCPNITGNNFDKHWSERRQTILKFYQQSSKRRWQ